jgi:hypothetical protein
MSYFYTNLPKPEGALGSIQDNVLQFMRYPVDDISIVTALHVGSLFGSGMWHLEGVTQTRKRVLMAP